MIIELLLIVGLDVAQPGVESTEAQPTLKVEKQIVYEKNQVVDLSGSTVEGENQAPPAFFVTKMQTPNAKSLLQERLSGIRLRDYNLMGF